MYRTNERSKGRKLTLNLIPNDQHITQRNIKKTLVLRFQDCQAPGNNPLLKIEITSLPLTQISASGTLWNRN